MTNQEKIQRINALLNQATAAIADARNLMKTMESELGVVPPKAIEGTIGRYTGDFMVTADGQKFEVPTNYASKSILVYGDTLKMYKENGETRFKQIERVKRLRVEGVLAKKEGKWHVVTSDGSYKVLEAAVEHFSGQEGDICIVLIPLEEKYAPFAAIESIPAKAAKAASGVSAQSQDRPSLVQAISSIAMEGVEAVSSAAHAVVDPIMTPAAPIAPAAVPVAPKAVPVAMPVKSGGGSSSRSRSKKKKPASANAAVVAATPVPAKAVVATPVAPKAPAPAAEKPAPISATPDASRILTDEDLR